MEEIKQNDIISRDLNYWDRVADNYDKALINRDTAEKDSRAFEDFEEEYFTRIVDEQLKKGNKLTLIEIGCGTGRYLRKFVKYENIKLLIGIDFSQKMIDGAKANIEKSNSSEIFESKVILVRGLGENVSVSLERSSITKDTVPVVICAFNTLGNIETENRRLEVLKKVRQIIGLSGIGIISVFNKDLIFEVGMKYYMNDSIEKLIIPKYARNKLRDIIEEIKKAILERNIKKLKALVSNDSSQHCKPISIIDNCEIKTDDFYSHWFTLDELTNLCKYSGLQINNPIVGTTHTDYRAKRGIIFTVTGKSYDTV